MSGEPFRVGDFVSYESLPGVAGPIEAIRIIKGKQELFVCGEWRKARRATPAPSPAEIAKFMRTRLPPATRTIELSRDPLWWLSLPGIATIIGHASKKAGWMEIPEPPDLEHPIESFCDWIESYLQLNGIAVSWNQDAKTSFLLALPAKRQFARCVYQNCKRLIEDRLWSIQPVEEFPD